jgi:ABC-type branched-subunit amino acid transport system substrate-binding protein
MLRKIISFIIIFLSGLIIVLCSESNDENNRKQELFIEGVSDSEIIVGMTAPFNEEPVGFIGNELLEGALTYIRNINDKGGVNGRTISIKTYDDNLEPNTTMEKTLRLINKDKVLSLFNYPSGYTTSKIVTLLKNYQIPIIGISSGDDVFRSIYDDYVFNVRASYEDEIDKAIQFLIETLEVSDIAILKQDDGYGKTRTNKAKEALLKYELKPVTEVSISPQATDFTEVASDIVNSNPEAVLVFSSVDKAGGFISQVRSLKPELYFYMTSEGFETVSLINRFIGYTEESRANIYITQVMPNPWDTHTELLKTYHNLSHKYYPEYNLNYYRMEGYINAMVLVKAIEIAGEDLSRDTLVKTLRNMKRIKLGEELVINYGKNDNQALEKVYIATIENGIFNTIE